MKHHKMEDLGAVAEVVPFTVTKMSRRERLQRWADLLDRIPGRLNALTRIEYLPAAERLEARADNSPLEIAYRDPVLREEGLTGDRLGEAMHSDGRSGEAIAPLRRAANLGAPGDRVWPRLAQALAARGRYLAALGAVLEGRSAGADPVELESVLETIRTGLGTHFGAVRHLVESGPS